MRRMRQAVDQKSHVGRRKSQWCADFAGTIGLGWRVVERLSPPRVGMWRCLPLAAELEERSGEGAPADQLVRAGARA